MIGDAGHRALPQRRNLAHQSSPGCALTLGHRRRLRFTGAGLGTARNAADRDRHAEADDPFAAALLVGDEQADGRIGHPLGVGALCFQPGTGEHTLHRCQFVVVFQRAFDP
ncbi:MAG: hypothetical protein IOMNBAOH_01511 [Rhodocyclaceae bacterium]|nr:hypothetical protein [Rhodocyclaceae bacterium]